MALLMFAGKTYPIAGEMILGRHRDCGIHIPDEQSSRKHARIFQNGSIWMIEDLGSANGTRLNGRALIAGPATIADGDLVSIGSLDLQFRIEPPDDAKPKPPPQVDLLNRQIADHRLEKLIGKAVTGTVYKAWQVKRERHVAFKAIDPRLASNLDFVERFIRDVTVAAGIQHPAVVRIFQCAKTDGVLWYAMELVAGETLAQLLQDPIAPRAALGIAIDLAEALQVYHEHGLVHGDVKPASVMIDGKKQLRLLDIGLIGLNQDEGRLVQSDGSTRQVYYLCPAQARGGQCNARSDIYSVGCILHHLLAGRPPYEGSTFAEVMAAHESLPIPRIATAVGFPPKLDEILTCMLNKDPFWRYEGMGFVVAELKELRTMLPLASSS
ncbi:MAG: protein kinase [Planctomycetes bacterium]|nr:protein kinase [Planctomycetota bacterium]